MHDDGQIQVNPYEDIVAVRRDQAFPILSEADISHVEQFGERRRYSRGERLFGAGERAPGLFVVLKGALTMTARDGLGRTAEVVRHGPGQFTGEVAQLSTGVALVDAVADDDDVETLMIPPDRLHALIVAEAELGEKIVRALILRRVAHIESNGSGPVLIGDLQSSDMLRLENFLRRNGQPHHAVDPSEDKAAALLLTQYGARAQDVLVACPNGSMLLTPSEDALARCLGMLDALEHDELFDVAVVGAGLPASQHVALSDRPDCGDALDRASPEHGHSRLCGDAAGRLASIPRRDKGAGIETTRKVRKLFVFIGADPETEWLDGCGVKLDAHGFVFTGAPAQTAEGLAPAALEIKRARRVCSRRRTVGIGQARRRRDRRRRHGGSAHPRVSV